MTLKQRLEAVWNSKKIASPSRFVKWSIRADYRRDYLEGLYYSKRRILALKKSK